jgi:hypothetical protein
MLWFLCQKSPLLFIHRVLQLRTNFLWNVMSIIKASFLQNWQLVRTNAVVTALAPHEAGVKPSNCCLVIDPWVHSVQNPSSSHLLSRSVKIKIYKLICSPVCFVWLYKSLYLKLSEERKWRVFENRMLRKIIALKMEEVRPDSRILHDEENHNSYCSFTSMVL